MKRILLYFILFCIKKFIQSDNLINDTTVCGMQNLDLYAISASVDSFVTDDTYTQIINLGFDFDLLELI